MSEQNIVNVMVIPDVPKVLPGEQLYVYVPKASFTSPGIIAYNNTQFRIDGNFLFIREDYVSPGVQQKIDELKQYTDDKLQLKQDKEDNNISLAQRPAQKSVVGAINDLGTLTGQAQSTADDAIRKIGDLSTLTTDEKSTAVNAINEVDQHTNVAQSTADEATNLANTGISKADQAQATADNATTLANTGISKAEQAQSTANTAVDKANDAKATAQEAILKADGRSTSIGFMTAKDAVTALNGYPRTQLKGGDTIWIVEDGTPDLWVTEVAQESIPYNYTTKDKFNQDLVDNKVLQIGYFKTAYQESDGKPVTIAWQNVLVKSTDWVASTEFADFPYEAKIELTDFVDYTTVPQVVFDIADTMSGNYAPICKSGDKCVYIYSKVQDEITLKTVITFAPNVNGASVTGGGYNNRGKWVASTTYAIDDLVYTDNGQFVCIEGITSTTSPEQDTQHWQATFVATGKTKNTLTISGQDNGTEVQKTFDGSTPVEVAFDENTMTVKEVDGVLKVGAKGTVPEALPQEASALKSGSLPITGWTNVDAPVWSGAQGNSVGKKPLFNLGVTWESQDAMPTTGWTFSYYDKDSPTSIYTDTKTWGKSDGGISSYIGDYFNLRIMPNGDVYFWTGSYNLGANYYILTEFTQTTLSKQGYTISDTSITANSDVLMELTDEGGVKAHTLASGSITVIRDTVPTQPIPYTYKVKQTNASGQFTLVNHFVPEVPESPTSLPVTYKKASGSLPTSGWTEVTTPNLIWEGTQRVDAQGAKDIYNSSLSFVPTSEMKADTEPTHWQYKKSDGTWADVQRIYTTDGTYNGLFLIITPAGGSFSGYEFLDGFDFMRIKNGYTSVDDFYGIRYVGFTQRTYTISDTSITANTSVKMYLTDEGGVKAYSKESGSITVIRDEVPTNAIPYEYEVEETSAEGLFEVINAYAPTKTSELTNDSGFAKTTEANTFTGVQTFSNADGIKTDRVHNLENNDAWYNFDGSNNRFGSPSRPTIIRTSEARPRAQVPSGETTVTKEIALLEDIANALYPVGSIYMSVNDTNPSTFFGGTWVSWGAGKVPVGVDTNDTSFATVEKTGGEKQHTLTIAEMPAHNHTIPCTPTANDGSEPTYQAAQVNAEATGNHNSIVAVSSGGGSPHNNLQPYITCYMWKRTA